MNVMNIQGVPWNQTQWYGVGEKEQERGQRENVLIIITLVLLYHVLFLGWEFHWFVQSSKRIAHVRTHIYSHWIRQGTGHQRICPNHFFSLKCS